MNKKDIANTQGCCIAACIHCGREKYAIRSGDHCGNVLTLCHIDTISHCCNSPSYWWVIGDEQKTN
jgi:hypothetical protein